MSITTQPLRHHLFTVWTDLQPSLRPHYFARFSASPRQGFSSTPPAPTWGENPHQPFVESPFRIDTCACVDVQPHLCWCVYTPSVKILDLVRRRDAKQENCVSIVPHLVAIVGVIAMISMRNIANPFRNAACPAAVMVVTSFCDCSAD